jgi:hypothetical protein
VLLAIVTELDKSYRPREIWDAVGLKKPGSSQVAPEDLAKLTPQQLVAVAFCLAAGEFKDYTGKYSKDYAAAGIELKGVLARAEKAATAAEKAKK